MKILNKHTPLLTRRVSHPRCPWITEQIRSLMSARDAAYRRYIRARKRNNENMQNHFEIFRVLRNKCTQLVRISKQNFPMQIIENTTNQREMWHKLNLLGIKGKRIKQQINNKFTPDELKSHFANIKLTNSVKFNLFDTNNPNHQNTLNKFSFESIDYETV